MGTLSDGELRTLLIEDPDRGWRAFLDQYTPAILIAIERAGVADRDHAADLYMKVCAHLAEDGCSRLRRHDPARGALGAWLTIVVRHVVVDWVRSRAGRRRLFGAIRKLGPLDQDVFALYYWEGRRAPEIAGVLGDRHQRAVSAADVFEALERIEAVLSDRHRAQLLALAARRRRSISLDSLIADTAREPAAPATPESQLGGRQVDAALAAALQALPAEDAAILRLLYVQGWTRDEVRRALHLDTLPASRVREILAGMRARLEALRIGPSDARTPDLVFLQDEPQ